MLFPWRHLYTNYGVGAGLEPQELNENRARMVHNTFNEMPLFSQRKVFLKYLQVYGYDVSDGDAAIRAFKAHFSANNDPVLYDAHLNQNDMYWAWALVKKYTNT